MKHYSDFLKSNKGFDACSWELFREKLKANLELSEGVLGYPLFEVKYACYSWAEDKAGRLAIEHDDEIYPASDFYEVLTNEERHALDAELNGNFLEVKASQDDMHVALTKAFPNKRIGFATLSFQPISMHFTKDAAEMYIKNYATGIQNRYFVAASFCPLSPEIVSLYRAIVEGNLKFIEK